MKNKYLFLVVFLFLLLPLTSSESFGYGKTEEIPINYSNIIINETANDTIRWNGNTWSDTRWLNINGDNANQDINIGIYDFYADDGFFDNINFSFLISNFGGVIDATGNPWYLSGIDFQIADNLIVDNNITSSYFIGDGSYLTNVNISDDYAKYQFTNNDFNGSGSFTTTGTGTFGTSGSNGLKITEGSIIQIGDEASVPTTSYIGFGDEGFGRHLVRIHERLDDYLSLQGTNVELISDGSVSKYLTWTSSGKLTSSTGTMNFDNENVTTTGNITGDYFFGDGSQLTDVGYWNRTGTVLGTINAGDHISITGNIGTTGSVTGDSISIGNGDQISSNSGKVDFTGNDLENIGNLDMNGNLNMTGNITAPQLGAENPTDVLSIAPDATGDLSGDAPSYSTDIGLAFFKNASNYVAHNNAGNENPQLAFYGGTYLGQKYGTIGVGDWGRLLFGGTVSSVVFNTALLIDTEQTFGGSRAGFLYKNTIGSSAWGDNHMTFGGTDDSSDEPVWIFTDFNRRNSNFNVPNIANPQMWFHDGSSTLTNYFKLYHDGNNGIINVTTGNFIIYNSTGYGTIEYGSAIDHTPTFSSTDFYDKLTNKENILDKDNKVVRFEEEKTNTSRTDFTRPVNVSSECVDIGGEKYPCEKETYPYEIYEEGRNMGKSIDINRIMIAELKQENQILKDALCTLDNKFSWCLEVGL